MRHNEKAEKKYLEWAESNTLGCVMSNRETVMGTLGRDFGYMQTFVAGYEKRDMEEVTRVLADSLSKGAAEACEARKLHYAGVCPLQNVECPSWREMGTSAGGLCGNGKAKTCRKGNLLRRGDIINAVRAAANEEYCLTDGVRDSGSTMNRAVNEIIRFFAERIKDKVEKL